MQKQDLKNLSTTDLEFFLKENKIPSFRAKQIDFWLWKKNVTSFSEMNNLPKKLQELLDVQFFIPALSISEEETSKIDKTIKYLFRLSDGHEIESVLIPSKDRTTACISTQVACSLNCKFCATGQLDFKRNLKASEIYEQVFILNEKSKTIFGHHLTNIVIMGMGEPLLNYEQTLLAIERITGEKGLAISSKRITLSTVGITKEIRQLADDNFKCNLAISLHFTNNEIREKYIPITKANNLIELSESIKYFYEKTKTRITYEYILFHKLNDSIQDAKDFADFCKITPCKINLIEYNATENKEFQKSLKINTIKFVNFLEDKNLIINLRRSKGKDISAACGQLAKK